MVCREIAGEDLSRYLFEGKKARCNREDLHITSSHFDEPQCRELIQRSSLVVTVHGEGSELDAVYIGGLHVQTIRALRATLGEAGFTVLQHENPILRGKSPTNICNLGELGEGVQLELAKGLRRTLFAGQTLADRSEKTERLFRLCAVVDAVVAEDVAEVPELLDDVVMGHALGSSMGREQAGSGIPGAGALIS